MIEMKAYIEALAYDLPQKVLTNAELAQEFPEWTEEKIMKKLGIAERHVVMEQETASDLAVNAAEKLFAENDIQRESVDLCSGWIFSLSLAKGLVLSGMAKRVLLLTAETYSKYLHPRDKGNRTIFGDGAAATLVGLNGFAEIGNFSFGTDGNGAENLIVKTGAARQRVRLDDLQFDNFGNPKSSDYLYMNGTEILNYTLDRIPGLIEEVLQKNGCGIDDIDLHVYHQANKYIANLQRVKMKIAPEKYYCCFERMGNTVSSTIPIALKEALNEGSIKPGFKVLSVAQGLGYSWGGVMLQF